MEAQAEAQMAAIMAYQQQIFDRSVANTISSQQKKSLYEFPLREPHWLSRVTFPAPGNDEFQTVLLESVKRIGNGDEEYPKSLPPMAPVKGEWVGPRKPAGDETPGSTLTEEENFAGLKQSVRTPITIFYVHGGAF